MDVTLRIPDHIAAHLTAGGVDLPRRALEAFALGELRAGRISEPEFGELLGLYRMEIDGFLKAHGIDNGYSLDEINEQVATLERLGC